MKPAEFFIAGAGIAGLASALALARCGHHVRVFEQATSIEEFGAGIQIGPNAARALSALGAWDELAPHTVAPQQIRIFDGPSGRVLRAIDLGQSFEHRYGAPYRVAHRGDLLAALHSAALQHPGIDITTAMRLEAYDVRPGNVVCHFTGGKLSTEALVAADGIHSAVRRHMHGNNSPQFMGHVIYRALLPLADVPADVDTEAICLWLCPGGHVVHYPVKSGGMINLVAATDDPAIAGGWNFRAEHRQVLDGFRGNSRNLQDLLAACASWHKWAAADHGDTSNWTDGPVTLVGDAAHASLPYLAQGAAMALEDAVVLAQCCARGQCAADAFRDFEHKRKSRTLRVIRTSRQLGRVYHLDGAMATLRNAAIAGLPGLTNPVRQDWIYKWRC